jgi:hypothetical protein
MERTEAIEIYVKNREKLSEKSLDIVAPENYEGDAPIESDGVITVDIFWKGLSDGLSQLQKLIEFPHKTGLHTDHAVSVLSNQNEDNGPLKNKAVSMLAESFQEVASELSKRVAKSINENGGIPTKLEEVKGFERNGILLLDSVYCQLLEELGETGKEIANQARQSAKNRWTELQKSGADPSNIDLFKLWKPNPELNKTSKPILGFSYEEEFRSLFILRATYYLTEALWEDEIKPKWERLRHGRPAVPEPTHVGIQKLAFNEGRRVQAHPEDSLQQKLWSPDDELIAQTPTLPEQKLARVVREGIEEFRGITGVRLLVHVIRASHLKYFSDARDPRVIEVEGGIQQLSREIGESGKGDKREKLRNILEAGQHWKKDWNGGSEGGLWTWRNQGETGPGKRSKLRIIVGDPLFPTATFKQPKGKRTLVPIVDIAPLVTPGYTYGPQAAFQQSVVRKIVEKRLKIPERGGAPLSLKDDLWPIADRLGLPQSTMKRVLERWTCNGDDGPQFLELVKGKINGKAVYHLADNEQYGLAKNFINETARRSKKASEAGKASALKRKNK